MKLICTQENFKKAVTSTERVVSKQNTLPILNNILFEAEKGGLKLSATNLEIGVVAKVGAKVEETGKIALPAKLVSSFISNLPQGETIELELKDNGLKIKSGKVKALIKGMDANDFPLIPQKNSDFLLEIDGQKLKNALSKVLVCVAFNEARQELTGVNFIFTPNEIFLAATDSFRLAEVVLKLEEKDLNKDNYTAFIGKNPSLIIPASTLLELNRIIPQDKESIIKIAIEEGQIFFELDGVRIVSRLINGKYPEYKHIMPKDFKTRIVGEKNMLQGAVRMASIFASGKTSEIALKIDSEKKKVFTAVESPDAGENSTELNFDITGPSQEVIFNSRYLLDGINSITTSKVAVLFNSESTPVALKEIDEKSGEVLSGFTYIVMPVKN